MSSKIRIGEKKRFLKWFTENYEMKSPDIPWMLKWIMSSDRILENLEFVDDVSMESGGLIVNTKEMEGNATVFFCSNFSSKDPDRIFREIRSSKNIKLRLQLNFPDKYECETYFLVASEEDFLAKKDMIDGEIDILLKDIVVNSSIITLKKELDKSLDNRDEETFIKLSKKLRELENSTLKAKEN